jgi:hypothetical protein
MLKTLILVRFFYLYDILQGVLSCLFSATLPHEKYYHMEAYERRMSALRQGEFVPPPDDSYDPQADMKAISGAHKKKVVEHESYLSKDQLQALRKVQHERIEVCLILSFCLFITNSDGVRRLAR